MATHQLTRTTDRTTRTRPGWSAAGRLDVRDDRRLTGALRSTARRRKERAAALRDWSEQVHPPLARSLRRRAAELELGAVALELRADGMDGGTSHAPEEQA